MATFTLCSMIPAAIAPLAGEELIHAVGFGAFFAVAAALCLLSAAIATRTPPDRIDRPHSAPATVGLVTLLRDRLLLPLWVITILWSIALSSRTFVVPFGYQVGIARVGWYFMLYSGSAVLVRLFGAAFLDRVGLERVLPPTLIGSAIALVLLGWTGHFGALEMAAVLGGLGHGYFYPALVALVIGHTRPGAMGRSSAIFNLVMDFGAMSGPYAFGMVADLWGYRRMFLLSAAVAFAAVVFYLAVEPAARRRGESA
jgi:predicted MFS family arabinose efflux permease